MTFDEILKYGTAVGVLINTFFLVYTNYRNAKKDRTKPNDEWRSKIEATLEYIKEKLELYGVKISRIEEATSKLNAFQRISLKSMKSMLQHLQAGNHTGKMQESEREIDDFLIEHM